MKATWIPDLLTELSFDEAAGAMRLALNRVLRADPSVETLALALAKTALETGRWKKMHRNNWGNIKCSDSYAGLFTTFRCNEVIRGKVVWFDPTSDGYSDPPGHPQCRFRAYATEDEGCLDYCKFVGAGRYKAAWLLLLRGDAKAYVHALKVAGYFTADEATYARGVLSLQREFVAKLQSLHVPALAAMPEREMCDAMQCVSPTDRPSWLTEAELANIDAHQIPYQDLLNPHHTPRDFRDTDSSELGPPTERNS